jgi:hypothetical protein
VRRLNPDTNGMARPLLRHFAESNRLARRCFVTRQASSRSFAFAATVALLLGGASQRLAALEGPAASAADPKLEAKLVDPEQKAKGQAATVDVKVTNLQLVDPGSVGEQPSKGQGHLHYQLDDGPVVATPTSKLSFHGLKPGKHRIMVMLAGNDHKPLGPEAKLEVTVPSGN